jgi:hypothetical protein
MKKSKLFWMVFSLALAGAVLLSLPHPAAASQPAQAAYFTPTAGADGRILYVVKSNETCLSISLLTGVPLDTLRKLNNLDADCVIFVGQKLLLGLGGPSQVSPTPGPSPTPTPLLPTPTPFTGVGQLCVVLYEDINGDAMRQEAEPAMAEGAISVSNLSGKVSLTGATASGDTPTCFNQIPEGDYNVSVAVPQGYNATTVMNSSIHILAGDQTMLEYGAQLSAKAMPTPVSEGGRSPLLGFIGGGIILVGLGLGIYVLTMRRRPTPD